MKKSIAIIVLVFTISSCEKIIPFTGEITQPKLVVNSLFENQNRWSVHISQSLSVLDTSSLSNIENATVRIMDDQNNVVEILTHDFGGHYTGITFPQLGENYRVEAEASGFTSVYSENNLPTPISIISVDTNTTFVDDEEKLEMSITFSDPVNINNYYLVSVAAGGWFTDDYWNGTSWVIDSTFYEFSIPILVDDPTFENYGSNRWENNGIFTDFSFDGQNKTIDIAINSGEYEYKLDDLEYFEVRIYNITEAAYLYNKSYNLYQNASGNPFAQPVQVYSNVSQGFGIFAGSQLNVFSIL
ncbi:MAG: DUF4249 domain-containing protein [Flavobacteriales bacterium]|jgi:hypothetical protein|nr:DUF4249 domain-containing protein [Flavobacteriales bacterium]